MVKQWQDLIYSGRHSQTYMNSLPDFVKLAEAYDHVGIQISKPEELEEKLRLEYEEKLQKELKNKVKEKTNGNYKKLQLDFDNNDEKFEFIKEKLTGLNFLETTPIEAFNLLYELQQKLNEGR